MRVEFLHQSSNSLVLQLLRVGFLNIVVVNIPHHLVEFGATFDLNLLGYTFINI